MTQIGAPKHEPINIGNEATPPFAVLPDPQSLFVRRARRLDALAAGHEIEGYLVFVAAVCQLQNDLLADLPTPVLPSPDRLALAKAGAMPPLARRDFVADEVFKVTLQRLLSRIESDPDTFPPPAREAAQRLAAGTSQVLQMAVDAVTADEPPADSVAEHVLLAAALQIHFARLAAMLAAADLRPVADGVCPVCGAPPVASAVVGWPTAENTRFCTCSLCATQWNVVRVKCVTCGSTAGIAYVGIEGHSATIKGETCEPCQSYVKILYQVNEPALDPVADDTATLALDLKLAEAGYARRAVNPFLVGTGAGTGVTPNDAPG